MVNLSNQRVEHNVRLGPNVHANADGEEIMMVERVVFEDEGVKAALVKLQLPEGAVVVCDPWIYGVWYSAGVILSGVSFKLMRTIGSDGVDDNARLWQCFLYLRDPENPSETDSNHYAVPLSISPVISPEQEKVIRIDHMPTGRDFTVKEPQPYKHRPANEYIPERQNLRKDLKPLHVVQPEGASFKVIEQGTSRTIEWQKWSFRVGFNQREGMVLYNVS